MTLVELMISMLILALVCVAWLEIIGIQSAKKEARRREAVERLAGMMDAFMYIKRNSGASADLGCCYIESQSEGKLGVKRDKNTNTVRPMFENESLGYQLCVTDDLPKGFVGWNGGRWLEGRLYNQHGTVAEVGKPFFT